MQADHGLQAHEESSTLSRPKPRQPGPEHPVGSLQVDTRALAITDEELVAKGEDLGVERSSGPALRKWSKGQGRESKPR